jgi:CRISPR-associated endonuclease/helicase Cas3
MTMSKPLADAAPGPLVPPHRFWAKLHPRDNPREWHPLIAHSADVAAVIERLLDPSCQIGQRLASAMGAPALTPRHRAQLIFAAALHDIGKTSHGFQTKAGRSADGVRWKNLNRGHVHVLLASVLHTPLREILLTAVLPHLGPDSRSASDLFRTIIAHHGRPIGLGNDDPRQYALWKADSARDPLMEMRRIIEHGLRWSDLERAAGEALPSSPAPFTHLFAGALTLADWIGSTRGAFPFCPDADDDPDAYWAVARERAAEACARIGVAPRTLAVPADLDGRALLARLFPQIFGEGSANSPTELQAYVAEMPLPTAGSRILIESETGSGKTEAALTMYARLRAAGRVGGMMFALPTRATASAMHARVLDALEGIYRGDERPTLALAVGGQQPRSESSEPLVEEKPLTYPDDAKLDPELEDWASSHGKKFLAAEIVIGTVDQVLLAGLPVKHAHLRLAALSRHFLVVDELHSYDRYMTEVLRRVLEAHGGAGGISLFMSATLSDAARTHLAASSGGAMQEQTYSLEEARAVAYPTVAVLPPAGRRWSFHGLESQGDPKAISWSAVREADALGEAAAAAADGASVCILHNTVRRARQTVEMLRALGHTRLLWQPAGALPDHRPSYHSRYTAPDRQALDRAITERFGKRAVAREGGVILIATQVAEQSLDVDFDLLITDLCPVDVMLQRIGRVHRHRARDAYRPESCRFPRALVISPPGNSFVYHLSSPALELGWGERRPYRHFADGELTLRLIADNPEIVIPRDNRRLVESVYHCDAREPLWGEPAWERKMFDAAGVERNLAWAGEVAALDFDQTYAASSAAFDAAVEGKVRTRLGDETIRIPLPVPVRGWYSEDTVPVMHVDLPAWALPRHEEGAALELEPKWIEREDDIPCFRLSGREYRYDPDGWTWSDLRR